MKNDNKDSIDVINFKVEHQPYDVFDSFVKFIQTAPLYSKKKKQFESWMTCSLLSAPSIISVSSV